VLAERRLQHDKSEDLRRALERRLRLRRLNKDPALTHDRSAFASWLFTQIVACDMLKKAECSGNDDGGSAMDSRQDEIHHHMFSWLQRLNLRLPQSWQTLILHRCMRGPSLERVMKGNIEFHRLL